MFREYRSHEQIIPAASHCEGSSWKLHQQLHCRQEAMADGRLTLEKVKAAVRDLECGKRAWRSGTVDGSGGCTSITCAPAGALPGARQSAECTAFEATKVHTGAKGMTAQPAAGFSVATR